MGVQRYWRLLSGGVLLVWQVSISLLDAGGRADFIIQHANQPEWFAVVLDALLHPTVFLTWPVIVLGFGLIWLDLREGKVKDTVKLQNLNIFDKNGVSSLSVIVTKIENETTVGKALFPNRLDLKEDEVRLFIVNFIKSLPTSQENSLFEVKSNSWKLILIESYVLQQCDIRKSNSDYLGFELISKTKIIISSLYMTASDVEIVITKLKQNVSFIKALPTPDSI